MATHVKFVVASGTGYVIDIRNNKPYLCKSMSDNLVLQHDSEGEAEMTAEQIRSLGYPANVIAVGNYHREGKG